MLGLAQGEAMGWLGQGRFKVSSEQWILSSNRRPDCFMGVDSAASSLYFFQLGNTSSDNILILIYKLIKSIILLLSSQK